MGALCFYGGFFAYPYFTMAVEFGKNANSATIVESYTHIVVFVWRQLGFAFFGALTSVGALFYFYFISKGEKQYEKKKNRKHFACIGNDPIACSL